MATLAKQQIVCLEDFRSKALKLLPPEVADYLEAGSGYEHTLNENRKAYSRSVSYLCVDGIPSFEMMLEYDVCRVSLLYFLLKAISKCITLTS